MSSVALHFRAHGPEDAPPLLLGGSLGTTEAMWDPQLEALSPGRRAIAFDLRGHGHSPVPPGPYSIAALGGDVLALLDRLQLARAAYCGLSIGGMVGQWLAVNAPERIETLILICTSLHMPPASAWQERAAAVRAAGSPEVVADAVIARWFTPEFAGREPELLSDFRAMIAATPAEGYAACCEAVADHDTRASVSTVRSRTLVMSGAQDPSIPVSSGREIADRIPGARFELLDPAAHLASVERADRVNSLIGQFLGEP